MTRAFQQINGPLFSGRLSLNGICIVSLLLLLILSTQVRAELVAKPQVDSLLKVYSSNDHENLTFDSVTTLSDYLSQASRRSPSLRQAFFNWQASLEKSGYAGALPDPVLSYSYYFENVETRVGPQEQKFSLMQKIPWFGTLGSKKEIASQGANIAYRKYQSEKLKLYYRVKSAYYDFYFLGRKIDLTHENLELMKFWESVTRTKYKVALKRHSDVIKAQVELGMLEDQLQSLKNRVQPTAARLREALNLPWSVVLPIPTSIDIDETSLERDSILIYAVKNNPDLKATEHLIEKERSALNLAGKSSLPSFTFGVNYIQTGPSLNPSMNESGKDPWMASVGINLPVWFGKNNSKKKEARANLLKAQYRRADAKNQLEAMVERILFEHMDALRKVRLYRDGLIPKGEQALNAGYTAYQAGELDFLNVLDAQRQLLKFQLEYERALSSSGKYRAEIDLITGNDKSDNPRP